jgi:hypothetical protein
MFSYNIYTHTTRAHSQDAETLQLTIHQAKGIPSVTTLSKQDPFCEVCMCVCVSMISKP